MGIWDAITEIVEAAAPWSVVEAEAPVDAPKEQEAAEETKEQEESTEEAAEEEKTDDAEESEEAEGEEEEEDEDEDEDEDDEEEIVDPKETIEEECKQSAKCAPVKHHYDECVERVQQQETEGEVTEDCVEEFFHLAHCATQCAAPKLWSKLK
ncbi:ubiquinol--cytochrome-c reductase subunit 6 [Lecanicillium sp. MT-2017a]|nr:ubiquinol--cytochrome-c reductase subunit 6 [Lecanicillium sp. MT-2017a]